MSVAKPFGDLNTATILVIGHDPRLQRSQTEAEIAFFFEYLTRPRPKSRPEARKYDLAQGVWDYIKELARYNVPLAELYVTNLCNEFLAHTPGSGTVLIPDAQAQRGVQQIVQIVADGHFKVILPMAVQPFYHLCRLGFVDEDRVGEAFCRRSVPTRIQSRARHLCAEWQSAVLGRVWAQVSSSRCAGCSYRARQTVAAE